MTIHADTNCNKLRLYLHARAGFGSGECAGHGRIFGDFSAGGNVPAEKETGWDRCCGRHHPSRDVFFSIVSLIFLHLNCSSFQVDWKWTMHKVRARDTGSPLKRQLDCFLHEYLGFTATPVSDLTFYCWFAKC
jgi:hypothetical protein